MELRSEHAMSAPNLLGTSSRYSQALAWTRSSANPSIIPLSALSANLNTGAPSNSGNRNLGLNIYPFQAPLTPTIVSPSQPAAALDPWAREHIFAHAYPHYSPLLPQQQQHYPRDNYSYHQPQNINQHQQLSRLQYPQPVDHVLLLQQEQQQQDGQRLLQPTAIQQPQLYLVPPLHQVVAPLLSAPITSQPSPNIAYSAPAVTVPLQVASPSALTVPISVSPIAVYGARYGETPRLVAPYPGYVGAMPMAASANHPSAPVLLSYSHCDPFLRSSTPRSLN